MPSAIDYLDGLEFGIPKSQIYDEIRELKKKLQRMHVMLYEARQAAKKANREKARTTNLLLKLRTDGFLKMTDAEIADQCFVTKRSVTEAKSRLKAKESKDENT